MFRYFLLLFIVILRYEGTFAQHHSPYSLQSAVDALHRREAQLALKENLNIPPRYIGPAEAEYWDDDSEPPTDSSRNGRHRLNKILERYLAHEDNLDRGGYGNGYESEFDDGNYLPDESKRSFFRERDEKYDPPQLPTAFREREIQPELAKQFLREIEEAREFDREEKYNEALRRLWDKYQQQENEIEGELFDERRHESIEPNNFYVGPLMQKKRTYPVLPWLPMSRRKRFPVAKRSANSQNDGTDKPETNDNNKVAKDLEELFGKSSSDKMKRSTDVQASTATEKPSDTDTSDHHNHNHDHQKRSESESESKECDDQDHEHPHPDEEDSEELDHGEEEEDDEHDDFEDEDDEERKKKRDLTSKSKKKLANKGIKLRMKKSVDWSKYFGIDRRKKSVTTENPSSNDEKKPNLTTQTIEDDQIMKETVSPDKLENMEKKLQNIEDLIIGDTIKYTGAHEGMRNSEDIRRFKDHVVSRLATAYGLEKMRRALDKLRQSVDDENHFQKNIIELDDDDKEKAKRLSVKKEKVEFDAKNFAINPKQCPILDSMAERCRSVNVVSGDVHQELLPICEVHQICYLCGESQVLCDFQYLSGADAVCGRYGNCQSSARAALMILRGTPGAQLGLKECQRNPCLYKVMRDMGL